MEAERSRATTRTPVSDDFASEAPLNGAPGDPPPLGRPRPWFAFLVVFGAQLLISFVAGIAPILAADMAPQLGVSAERLGIFTALSYVAAIGGGLLVAPWIGWMGPIRSIQVMLLAAAVAALLAALGSLAGVVLAALALGISMGFPHPAFTAILSCHAPRQSIGLFFRCASPPRRSAWLSPLWLSRQRPLRLAQVGRSPLPRRSARWRHWRRARQ
ncbi:MAG: hypothetical protein N2688_02150 [Burkholderiaceae bacterium]|nr:hypothetical protein [Burkholderiaceae bacterium]